MATVKVYHLAFEKNPVHVADVEAPKGSIEAALAYAWRWTNNIAGSWSGSVTLDAYDCENPDWNDKVTVIAPRPVINGKTFGHRSTSVGDIMMIHGKYYEVAGVGFKKLKNHPLKEKR